MQSMRERGDGVCADRGRSCPRFDVRPVVDGMVDPELVRRLVLNDQRTAVTSDRALNVLAQRRVQRDATRALRQQTGLHRLGENIAGVTGAPVGEHVVGTSDDDRIARFGRPPSKLRRDERVPFALAEVYQNGYNAIAGSRGVPKRDVLWAPGTRYELRTYPKRVRRLIGRGIEVAQWGQTDTHAKRMQPPLREVYEIVVEGDNVTHRAAYFPTVDADGPIAVLDVFIKKSKSGAATPQSIINRIKLRLKRIKEILP